MRRTETVGKEASKPIKTLVQFRHNKNVTGCCIGLFLLSAGFRCSTRLEDNGQEERAF